MKTKMVLVLNDRFRLFSPLVSSMDADVMWDPALTPVPSQAKDPTRHEAFCNLQVSASLTLFRWL
jgi:hypothetical protein